MKFRSATAPSAAGPLMFASSVAAAINHPHLLPHTRDDATQTVDGAVLVLESSATDSDAVWAVQGSGGEWRLPRWALEQSANMTATTTAAWDASNVIGEVLAKAEPLLNNVKLGWLSFIADSRHTETTAACSSSSRGPAKQFLTRVYGHTLLAEHTAAAKKGLERSDGAFVTPALLARSEERGWVQQWQESVDAQGRVVRRGVGMPRDVADDMRYNHAGNGKRGHYRVGVFGEDGRPVHNPLAQ
jgi:hypothetical protein